MSDRDKIFSAIRDALAPLEERAPLPEWDDDLVASHNVPEPDAVVARFRERLEGEGGQVIESPESLAALLREQNATVGYCDPALADRFRQSPAFEGIELRPEFDAGDPDAFAFGITRASAAIAETGTLVFKDRQTSSRLGALAPMVHIAILEKNAILPNVVAATAAFGDDPSIVWVTGPSKTADVEGILIKGVHGPGVQICLLV